jgi:hypothetical protein
MNGRKSINRYPEKSRDWDRVALKYQRSVDAEEARARAKILKEIATMTREQKQLQLKLDKRGGRP